MPETAIIVGDYSAVKKINKITTVKVSFNNKILPALVRISLNASKPYFNTKRNTIGSAHCTLHCWHSYNGEHSLKFLLLPFSYFITIYRV